MPSAVSIARLIAHLLPADGELPDAAVRGMVRRKLASVGDVQYRTAVILGRASGYFQVAPDGALSRCVSTPKPEARHA